MLRLPGHALSPERERRKERVGEAPNSYGNDPEQDEHVQQMQGSGSEMTKRTVKINVEYLTRVEGHGNIVVNVEEGKLDTCRLDIVESPRFFEGMLRGRSIFEAQHITSRICGICACGHTLASIQAAEDALGITPSEQTVTLRKLLLHFEML